MSKWEGEEMREITREQAESLITNSKVLQSSIDHEQNDLVVYFELADQRSLHVHYNTRRSSKTYFINGKPVTSDK